MILSVCSLFVGVLDIRPSDLFTGSVETWEIFLISRLPRLLAILCTGIGMSVAGLIMQQLCMNKFVSPTTGATISSAQFGILLALLFAPGSTLWGRAAFSFVCAVLGTWVFVWFIQRIQFKDVVMVPLVGIMFSNIVMGVTIAIQFTQNFLGVQPECGQVCKFVKEFRPDLLGVCTAGIEVPCKLVEVAAHLAALSKQGGNSGQGFFSAAGNDDRFLDFDVVDGTADKSGEGEIQEFASEFQ